MPATRALLATVLSTLSCAVVVPNVAASYPPAGQSSAGPVRTNTAGRRYGARAERARAGCAKGSARASRRARLASRVCRADAHKLRAHRPATRRPAPPLPASSIPVVTSAPAAGASSSDSATAAIAATLATSCQNTQLTPEAGDLGQVRAAVLCLINRKRAESAELPLQSNPQLEQAAEGHCQELISDDYFAHVAPSGETPVDRIRTTGYIPTTSDGYVIGENLAWGTYQLSTPEAIVSAWIASPGHLANILEAQYRETGIGVTPAVPAYLAAGSPGATYAQEFGVIIH